MIVISLLLIAAAATTLVWGLASESNALLFGSIVLSLFAAIALYLGARQAGRRATAPSANGGREGFLADVDAQVREPAFATTSIPRAREESDTGEFARLPAGAGFMEPDHADRADQEMPGFPPPDLMDELDNAGPPPSVASPLVTVPTVQEPPPDDDMAAVEAAERYEAVDRDPVIFNGHPDEPVAAEPEFLFREPAEPPAATGEDPSDEPEQEETSPAEGARVVQVDGEVAVVDGRPRYHLLSCRHLAGREAEPLPVAEAVELGFTPCGWCRPVASLLVGNHAG